MHRPIHFLCYLNRSGSTLLANKLNKFSEIAVGLEGLEIIVDRFIINNIKDIKRVIKYIYNDKKFKNWDIDKDELIGALSQQDFPIFFYDLLKTCLNIYFKKDPAEFLIHKGGKFIKYITRGDKQFSESKCIFIDRDPRGVFNSQSRSIDSRNNKIMQDDIVLFAISYKNMQFRISKYLMCNKFINPKKLIVVKYEDLLENEEIVIKKIFTFLGCNQRSLLDRTLLGTNKYSKLIPDSQKHLHINIEKCNLHERIAAWQGELPKHQIYFLEKVLKKELIDNGYNLTGITFNKSDNKFFILISLLKFFLIYYPQYFVRFIFNPILQNKIKL